MDSLADFNPNELGKIELLELGKKHILRWCERNNVPAPKITERTGRPDFGVCAYYRPVTIHIWPDACAGVGIAGRQWSYPGYAVDRTPYGVLAHELGHHVDEAAGRFGGIVARTWMEETQEPPITNYDRSAGATERDPNEWFAEMFRLFVTNPSLLMWTRPNTFRLMVDRWPNLVEERPWRQVLAGSDRHIAAAENKIRQNQFLAERRKRAAARQPRLI